jgi:isoamylase
MGSTAAGRRGTLYWFSDVRSQLLVTIVYFRASTQNCANFALFSANAAAVDLCLFTEADLLQGRVSQKISLCPDINRTGDVWHIALPDLNPSLLYGYVLHGPDAMAEEEDDEDDVSDDDRSHVNAGQVFDPSKVVLDPRAAAIFNGRRSFGQLGPSLEYGTDGILGYAPTWPQAAAAVPSLKRDSFDWEGDRPLNRPMEDLVIYEAHVRGFTAHPSANVPHPGELQRWGRTQLHHANNPPEHFEYCL